MNVAEGLDDRRAGGLAHLGSNEVHLAGVAPRKGAGVEIKVMLGMKKMVARSVKCDITYTKGHVMLSEMRGRQQCNLKHIRNSRSAMRMKVSETGRHFFQSLEPRAPKVVLKSW